MGGRLDSTNIIEKSIISVITGIALDHTAFLGDTVEKIAAEKAGIIKRGCPVLLGGENDSVKSVIAEKANERGSRLYTVDYSALDIKQSDLDGTRFDLGEHKDIEISLLGTYQPRNAAAVISAVDIMRSNGFDISEAALKNGLKKAAWHARFEIIRRDPLVIFDGAHNPDGVDAAVRSIENYFGSKGEKVFALTGVLADKDYNYIASRIASVSERAFVISPDNPRALPASEYADVLRSHGLEAIAFNSLADAVKNAVDTARKEGRTLVCLGSLYLYGDIIKLI
jgi:dihydrofolate synthase/folylpolyglutamate synthase